MMKRSIVFLIIGIVFSYSSQSYAQCQGEKFLDGCASLLGDYVFVKSFEIGENRIKKAGFIEYSYVLSKGTSYVITVCDEAQPGGKMIVELYDRNRKKIASSYSKKTKKHYPKIGYSCTATGVYYLKYTFEKNKANCGVSILGFSKK